MATPLEDEVRRLTDSIESLIQSMGDGQKQAEDTDKATLKLGFSLASYGKIQQALTKASELQLRAMRVNADTTKALSHNLSKGPGFTNLNANLAMLETGLDGNSKELSDFLVRADLLGENVDQMAGGLQTLRGTLGLTITETGQLSKNIMDSAKTYRTSSESVVAGLKQLGSTLTVLSRSSGGGTDLVTDIIAATQRAAPGAAAGIMNTLFGAGAEGLGRMATLGIGQEGAAMMGPQASMSDAIALFEGISQRMESIVGTGEGAIVGAQIFEEMTSMNVGMAQQAAVIAESLREAQKQSRLNASINDALGGLNSIFDEFKTGLGILTERIIFYMGGIKELFENEMVRYLIQIAGSAAVLASIAAAINIIKVLTRINSMKSLVIYGIISLILPAVMKLVSSSKEIEDSTKTTADIAKKNQESRTLSLMEQYNKRHAAALQQMIRQSSRSRLEPSLSERAREIQNEKTIQLTETMVKLLSDQSDMMAGSKSSFNNNPTGVKA